MPCWPEPLLIASAWLIPHNLHSTASLRCCLLCLPPLSLCLSYSCAPAPRRQEEESPLQRSTSLFLTHPAIAGRSLPPLRGWFSESELPVWFVFLACSRILVWRTSFLFISSSSWYFFRSISSCVTWPWLVLAHSCYDELLVLAIFPWRSASLGLVSGNINPKSSSVHAKILLFFFLYCNSQP